MKSPMRCAPRLPWVSPVCVSFSLAAAPPKQETKSTHAFHGTQIEVSNRGLCEAAGRSRASSANPTPRSLFAAGFICGAAARSPVLPAACRSSATQARLEHHHSRSRNHARPLRRSRKRLLAGLRGFLYSELWREMHEKNLRIQRDVFPWQRHFSVLCRIFRRYTRLKIKLVLYSHDWFPLVGGVQTVTLSLATGLATWGETHPGESIEVIFITQTPAELEWMIPNFHSASSAVPVGVN